MKNAAIIGISNYARHHLLMALEQALHGRLRLVAATIVNQAEEEFFCERLRGLGCEIFTSTAAMWARVAGRVDLCFIPTGIHSHAPMTLEALRAGASVLVEKPLATSVADAAEVMRVERETGRFVAVGFQDLYADSTWELKRFLLDGGIGKLRTITFCGLWPRPASYYQRNQWAGRLQHEGRPVLDSPANNAFAHFLNLALFWGGANLDDSAGLEDVACELYRAQAIESFDTCCLRAQFTGGVEFCAFTTHSCREERIPRLRLEGTRGRVEWVQESHYEVTAAGGSRKRHAVPGKFETQLMMADAVLARFENPAARICGTGIAVEHVRLIEAMHQAAPIIDVPAQYLQRRRTTTGDWTEIAGIESAIDEAAAHGRLWSETDTPWAQRLIPLPRSSPRERPAMVAGARLTRERS